MIAAGRSTERAGRLLAAVLAVVCALASGCASAPPETFYTLTAGVQRAVKGAAPPVGLPGPGPSPRTVVVAPAAVPELVDRPQLVLKAGDNRVVLLEQRRWGEPLRAQIARVVAEDLGGWLDGWRIATREDALPAPDCRVTLDVRRFDSSRTGPAVSDVLWRISCVNGAVRTGQSAASEPVAAAPGDALAPVVAAHGRALDRLSRHIAQGLREAAGEPRP